MQKEFGEVRNQVNKGKHQDIQAVFEKILAVSDQSEESVYRFG